MSQVLSRDEALAILDAARAAIAADTDGSAFPVKVERYANMVYLTMYDQRQDGPIRDVKPEAATLAKAVLSAAEGGVTGRRILGVFEPRGCDADKFLDMDCYGRGVHGLVTLASAIHESKPKT